MNRQQLPNSSSEKKHSPSPGTFCRSYASFDTSMDSNRLSSTGYGVAVFGVLSKLCLSSICRCVHKRSCIKSRNLFGHRIHRWSFRKAVSMFSCGRFSCRLWMDIGLSSFRGSAACKIQMHLFYIRYISVCWNFFYYDVYQLSDRER